MSKLTTYQNPVSGQKSNLFDFGNLWSQLLGAVVLILVLIFGQRVAGYFVKPEVAEAGEPPITRIIL